MVSDIKAWLDAIREKALEPDLPIIDPHHHLWDYPESLPEEGVPPFARPVRHYLLDQFLGDLAGGHNIRRTVFVECNSMYRRVALPELHPVGETEFVQGIAAQSASGNYGPARVAAGIIGFADLTLGSAVRPVLEAHVAASRNRFRGVRYISTWDGSQSVSSRAAAPELLADAKFREGFNCLQRYNLSFDAWLYHTQLGDLVNLARAFPYITIVLDHIGGPLGIGPYADKREEVLQDWKNKVALLAGCPNVFIKLGGLGMPLMGFGWHERETAPDSVELAQAMTPYFSWCIEKLGTQRCMFESNFPVDRCSYSYTILWNAFKRFAQSFSAGERAALFYETAARAYRLADVTD
jgi:L-fuconolactonase